jgi:AhpD family alkylhydroperoxidase
MFFRVSKVTQCPFCEQEHIRPAAEQEKQQFNAAAEK